MCEGRSSDEGLQAMAYEDGDHAAEVHGVLEVAVKPKLHAREVGLARDGRAGRDKGVRGWQVGRGKLGAQREEGVGLCGEVNWAGAREESLGLVGLTCEAGQCWALGMRLGSAWCYWGLLVGCNEARLARPAGGLQRN